MKWTKINDNGSGYLGQGYRCGEYVIEETYNSYNLQKQYGGKKSDYYWKLSKGNNIIKYASTAKTLKQFAETL